MGKFQSVRDRVDPRTLTTISSTLGIEYTTVFAFDLPVQFYSFIGFLGHKSATDFGQPRRMELYFIGTSLNAPVVA